MRTPILIPAFNEAARISDTLASLPRNGIEPIVLVNGSEDRTADIARNFGAEVREFEKQGKLPALQSYLGNVSTRAALRPFLLLDADTQPVFPDRWLAGMLEHLTQGSTIPGTVSGPIWFTGPSRHNNAARTFRRFMNKGGGPNMGLRLATRATLEAVLELPHYWPGEDKALQDIVLANGGQATNARSPYVYTKTPLPQSYAPLGQILKSGHAAATAHKLAGYVERGAPGSQPYIAEW